jgi:hypothetical protein
MITVSVILADIQYDCSFLAGELMVWHGDMRSSKSGKESLRQLPGAANSAKCTHEILAVQKSYRLALIYSLLAEGTTSIASCPVEQR